MNIYASLTAAELTSINPVVPVGEIWMEKDTGYAKRGNGATTWTNLSYWQTTPTPTFADDDLANGELVPPNRHLAYGSTTAASLVASQQMTLAFFTARRSESITTMETYTGGTAAGATPTLCQMALYSIARNGDGTLLAASTNDTALWASTNTVYSKTLDATVSKVAGQRYAGAVLIVTGAAVPVLTGPAFVGAAQTVVGIQRSRPVAASLTGQASLPASFTAASLGAAGRPFTFRLS